MSKLAKVAVTFTHNGQTFNVNEIGSFSDEHFVTLSDSGQVTADPADVSYGAQFGIKVAQYDEPKPVWADKADAKK